METEMEIEIEILLTHLNSIGQKVNTLSLSYFAT